MIGSAAMVAGLLPRPVLVILSDVQGLYDRDPTADGAKVVETVEQIDQTVMNSGDRSSKTGSKQRWNG